MTGMLLASKRDVMRERGFTVAEVLLVVAIIGILAAMAIPVFSSYLRSAAVKAGAEELVAALNQARQLAIAQNRTIAVEFNAGANQFRYLLDGNGATPWIGPGVIDGQGWMRLANNMDINSVTATPQFFRLGNALGSTINLRSPDGSRWVDVVVAVSGRIQIRSGGGL